MNSEDKLARLMDIIDEAFNNILDGEIPDSILSKNRAPMYTSIQEYTERTGKRFRMTQDQMKRGLDRDTAFSEFLLTIRK